jgi:hypothetical protein
MSVTDGIQFYRAMDPTLTRRLAWSCATLALGAFTLLMGSLSLTLAVPALARPVCALIGVPLLLFGLVNAFVSLPRALAKDRSLTVRRDGLLFEGSLAPPASEGAKPVVADQFFAWKDLGSVQVARTELRVCLLTGEERVFPGDYANGTPAEMSTHVERLRQRAMLNML